jgi:hypothetical protein
MVEDMKFSKTVEGTFGVSAATGSAGSPLSGLTAFLFEWPAAEPLAHCARRSVFLNLTKGVVADFLCETSGR